MEEEIEFENGPRVKDVGSWVRVLEDEKLRDDQKALEILEFFYGAEDFISCCRYADDCLSLEVGSANGTLTNFNKRVVKTLGLGGQVRADGTSRFWNVAFKHPSKESSLPYFMMQLRPELVGAIERVFPRWRKNNADFRMEVLNRKIKQSSWEPLRDEEIVFESLDVKIAPEKAVNQEVSDSAAPQRVDCYKRAVSEICNSEDGRKVEERVFQWEYDKLEGKAPEGVLKRMKDFFEHRQDRYGYDVLCCLMI